MYKTDFDWLRVTLASVADIEGWSHWVVESPDTVNYRTWKPKQHWLFCEAIFWPVKNYECSCWKYKWVRYKWIVCERCWVEVTSSRVRRYRMWHVELASPVLHARYKSSSTWWIHQLLELSSNEIDKVLTFVKYIVTTDISDENIEKLLEKIEIDYNKKLEEIDELYKKEIEEKTLSNKEIEKLYENNKETLQNEFLRIKSIVLNLKFWMTILESDFRNVFYRFSDLVSFSSWSEAILKMLKSINVEKEIKKRLKTYKSIRSEEKKKKELNLIKLLINLHVSWVKPENMVITKLPVIPADLRPVIQLDWWRFASSDVNLFYRRVLMRNIRLKKMIQVWMPDVVKKNEIRLLQDAVNNLLVWEKWTKTWWWWAWIKVFKSLSDMLSWKEWIFRKNLLWKRVDYSWRSIITVWPDLTLNECWLPIYIAVKMFTPFIIWKLIEKKIVYNPKQAEKLIKDEDPIALKFLEEVIKDKYVLLNRAPTLHRLWIEAFRIKLMPWKTIRIHPLVCWSFNADFDWDQMAVHLPISDEAQREARELIAADKNILRPGSWEPTLSLEQDMVLWVYYLTDFFDNRYPDYNTHEERVEKTPVKWYFSSSDDVLSSFYSDNLYIKDKIILNVNWEYIPTTVGRVIFNNILPEWYNFVNNRLWKKDIKKLVSTIFDKYWIEETVKVSDDIKNLWFKYATFSSTTVNIFEMKVPKEKEEIIKGWKDQWDEIYKYYFKWFLSEEEKYRLIIKIWMNIKEKISATMKDIVEEWDNLFTIVNSWARWSFSNIIQICWMKWLVVNPKWEIIELPIISSFIEWLKPIEYFLSAHAWRKWKADTALRTAESWYLTRKLCDSSQEVIVRWEDCWTDKYLLVTKDEYELQDEDFYESIFWRVVFEDVKDSRWNVVIKKWEMLDKNNVELLKNLSIEKLKIRSSLTCKYVWWVCQKCYWMDLSTRKLVDIWIPVWIIWAQSIWEPWTQLTLNTFHGWWVAWKTAETSQGIDRIKQLLEVRTPKFPAVIAPYDWTLEILDDKNDISIRIVSEYTKKTYLVKSWYEVFVKEWEDLEKLWSFAKKWRSKLKVNEAWRVLEVHDDYIVIWIKKVIEKQLIWIALFKWLENWQKIYKWDILTTWALDVREYKDIVWDLHAQKYIIKEVKSVYRSQWQWLNEKHIEIIVRQLFLKVFIEDSWESDFIPWTSINYREFLRENEELRKQWKKEAKWKRLALWLTSIAKWTWSWLSAASFQETIRVMVWASVRWDIDELNDLKSNVIIWRLLPIGEIYRSTYNKKNTKKNNIIDWIVEW